MIKQAAKEAVILILIAVTVAIVLYAIRPDKITNTPAGANGDAVRQASTENGFTEISLGDAARLFDEKKAVFADARHRADFDAGHIQGAIHLNAADLDVWISDLLGTTDPTTVIITYCDGEACPLAPELAEILFFNGFDHVRYLENGWTRWRERGLAVE